MLGKCPTRDLYRQPEEQVVYSAFKFKLVWEGGLMGKAPTAQDLISDPQNAHETRYNSAHLESQPSRGTGGKKRKYLQACSNV